MKKWLLLFIGLSAVAQAEDVFMTLSRGSLSKSQLPTSVETIRPEDFEKFSAQTAGEAISHLTSVQIQPVSGLGSVQTVRMRGATTNQSLVMINGRPVGGVAFASSQDLSEIPVEMIERIEVIRGGASALYGPNAIGGVINVITKTAPTSGQPAISVGYDIGSYGRNIFRSSFGRRQGPVDYFLYGNKQNENGFRDNSEASTYNVGGNTGLSLGTAGKVTLEGSAYHARTGIPGQFSPAIATNRFNNDRERVAVSPDADQETSTRYAQAGYRLPLPANMMLGLKLFGSERRVRYEDASSFVDTDRFEYSKGGDVQLDLPLGFMVGGSFLHDREESRDLITPTNSFQRSVENWGLFAQETFSWKALTFISSVRYDKHSQFGDSTNPRFQGIVDATPWLRLSGSAAKSFRAPTIDELYYPLTDYGCFSGSCYSYEGNPSLRPEKAWTYDGGFELHQDSASFKVTYFRSIVSDLIQTTLDPASTVINVGDARRQGMEVQFNHVANRWFRDSLNYTYLDNRGVPPGSANRVELRYSPRHTVNYTATLSPLENLDWDHTLRYLDKRFSGNNETGTKLGSMVLWDMRLAARWKQLEATFTVRDVTDRRYEEQAGYPLPGRTFIGGVTWRY